MKKFVTKNLFLILVICVVIFSFIFPKPGLFVKSINLLPTLTFIAMFLSGLSLSLNSIKDSFKNYKLILFSAFMAFAIFPAISYLMASLFFANSYDAFVGAIIISTQASTVTSAIVLTMAAKGNVSLAIIMTVINNLISAFVTPPLLKLFLSSNKVIDINVLDMILNLLLVLVLPIILGMLCVIFLPKIVKFINRGKKAVANTVVLFFVLIGASTAASKVMENLLVLLLIISFVVILHLIILGMCYAYAKLIKAKQEDIPSLLFCSSEKTMTTSTMIWGTYFSQYLIAPVVIVLYHLSQIIIDSILAGSMSKKAEQLDTTKIIQQNNDSTAIG